MQPGRGYGFGYGPGPPYRPPVPPELQMAPQESEAVLMATGRLAAEYLTNRGDLPAKVLENRPPAPIPRSLVGVGVPRDAGIPDVPLTRTSAVRPCRSSVSRQSCPHPFYSQGQRRPSAPHRRFPAPPPVPSRPRPVPEAPTPRPVWTGFLPRPGTPAGHRHDGTRHGRE